MFREFKDFLSGKIREWDLVTLGVAALLLVFSIQIIQVLFWVYPPDQKVSSNVDAFYNTIYTIVIYLLFKLVSWRVMKVDEKVKAKFLQKESDEVFKTFSPTKKYYLSYGRFIVEFLLILGVAAIVFP